MAQFYKHEKQPRSNITVRVLQACFSCKEFATRTEKKGILHAGMSVKKKACVFFISRLIPTKSTAVIIKTKWHWMNLYSQIRAVFKGMTVKKPIPK